MTWPHGSHQTTTERPTKQPNRRRRGPPLPGDRTLSDCRSRSLRRFTGNCCFRQRTRVRGRAPVSSARWPALLCAAQTLAAVAAPPRLAFIRSVTVHLLAPLGIRDEPGAREPAGRQRLRCALGVVSRQGWVLRGIQGLPAGRRVPGRIRDGEQPRGALRLCRASAGSMEQGGPPGGGVCACDTSQGEGRACAQPNLRREEAVAPGPPQKDAQGGGRLRGQPRGARSLGRPPLCTCCAAPGGPALTPPPWPRPPAPPSTHLPRASCRPAPMPALPLGAGLALL